MKVWGNIIRSAAIVCLIWSDVAWSISKELHAMIRMETQSNAVAQRESDFVRIEHYEIPLELVEKDIAERANQAFIDTMIFENKGKKYVRWVINPEDTKWHLEVEKFLLSKGIKPERKKHFIGYMTASRSYIVVDPYNGAEFSIKMSTDRTGGNWRDKQQTWDDAKQIRSITDFVYDQLKTQPRLRNTILLDEPMAFGIKALDQAMVIRSYEELKKSGKRYVPGFSIVHETFGKELALANGDNNPARYWDKNYNLPLARALAEFAALTGMAYDSPHSQNFMVELDSKNRPTGRVVLRDFGDTYLAADYFKAVGREDILKAWEQSNIKKGALPMAVGILHGNSPPSWINMEVNNRSFNSYDQWGREFFAEFEKEFKSQTGISLSRSGEGRRSGAYIAQGYSLADEAGQKFIQLASEGKARAAVVNSCARIF